MKRLLCGAAVAAALLISATPSSAQVVNMTATLTGAEETTATPGVLGLLTGAVGTATVAVDATNEEISVTLTCSTSRPGPLPATFTWGREASRVRWSSTFPIPAGRTGDLPLTFRLGAAAFVARPEIGINTMQDAIQAIVGGGAYVNIHTSAYPAGEIRGQLTVVPVRS